MLATELTLANSANNFYQAQNRLMLQEIEVLKEKLREAREHCMHYYEMWAEECERRDEKANELKRRISLLATTLSMLKSTYYART